ncbi:MAG: tRNA adenosine(34) deaminase TadA [Pseudomonadota bacterium]
MRIALAQAKTAATLNEVPVGAVLARDNTELARGYNESIQRHDATAHAEVVVLRKAGLTLGNYRLPNTTLYVTLEPCAMCVGAMLLARVERVVFGASDPKTGALGGALDLLAAPLPHRLSVTGGVLGDEAGELLREFFKARRR